MSYKKMNLSFIEWKKKHTPNQFIRSVQKELVTHRMNVSGYLSILFSLRSSDNFVYHLFRYHKFLWNKK